MYLSAIGGVLVYLGAIARLYEDILATGTPTLSLTTIPNILIFTILLWLSYQVLTLFLEINFDIGKRTRIGAILTFLGSIVLAATVDIFIRNGLVYITSRNNTTIPIYLPTEATYIIALSVIVLQIVRTVKTTPTVGARVIIVMVILLASVYYLLSMDRSIINNFVTNIKDQSQILTALLGGGKGNIESSSESTEL